MIRNWTRNFRAAQWQAHRMIERIRSRAYVAMAGGAIAAVAMQSCTPLLPEKPYPADWPKMQIVEDQECRRIDGKYENVASAATNGPVMRPVKYPDARLQALLSTGRPTLDDTWSAASRSVVISGQSATLDDGTRLQSAAIAIRCETDGTLLYEFKQPSHGESFVGHETTRIVLSRLESGALSSHQLIERRGFTYFFLPYSESLDDWYLFQELQ